MDTQNAKQWLAVFSDLSDDAQATCRHGHGKCSDVAGGECLDDVIRAAVCPAIGGPDVP